VVVRGESGPKELLVGRLVTEWVQRLDPSAAPEQLVAARAHHLKRWTRPRSAYPEGRAGYLRWRADAKKVHADEVAQIVESVGYPPDFADRVGQLIRKEGLKRNATGDSEPQVQTHEDAICLAFLETQLDEFVERVGADRGLDVLAKTAAKMSDRALALIGDLELSDASRQLLSRL
jgi:hypothetical protein